MSQIVPFVYQGQQVRTVMVNGEPHFVAKDVCDVLGLTNSRMAVQGLDEDDVSTAYITDSLGREQAATVVNEPGVYQLVFQSRRPEAKMFRRWITHDVIPAIRSNGAYLANPMTTEDMIILQAQSVKELRAQVSDLEQRIEHNAERLEDTRRGLVDVNAPLRNQFNRAVRDLSNRSGMPFNKAYDCIYDTLSAQEHIDIKRRAENRGVRPIDIVEQTDLLVKAIRLAKAL